MIRHRLTVILVIGFGAIAAMAQPKPAETYHVTFDGIIMHNLYDLAKARALVVRGTDDMPHQAILVTPADIDINAMRKAIGQQQAFSCNGHECRFHIDGVSIRVGRTDPNLPIPGPVKPLDTFKNYTPHMKAVTKGDDLYTVVSNPLPSGPVAAYFELVGGELSACTFPGTGFFFPDYDQESERKFTDKVMLDGYVDPNDFATLQVQSYLTNGWVAVGRLQTPTKPLFLTVENHSPMVNGQVPTSNLHFAINAQLINTKYPFPSTCVTTIGAGDDPSCPPHPEFAAPRAAATSESSLPGPLVNDLDCKSTAPMTIAPMSVQRVAPSHITSTINKNRHTQETDGGNLDLIIGCSNSQWP